MKNISGNEFKQEVLDKENLVLVDFYATWCGPCMMLAPILEEVGRETEIEIIKIDVDQNSEIAHKYQIQSIPTMIYFKKGQIVSKDVGSRDKVEIINKISELK